MAEITVGDEPRAFEASVQLRFLPALPRSGELSEVRPALKPLEDQGLALPVYTSLEYLVEGCGKQQPWVAVRDEDLEQVFHDSQADVVIVDAALPEEAQWSEQTEAESFEEFQRPHDMPDADREGDGNADG